MHYKALTIVLLLWMALPGSAAASDIYKWTDEQGSVHYTDKPLHQPSELLSIISQRTNNAAIQAQTQARSDARAEAAKLAAQNPQGPTTAERRAQAAERASKCNEYKARLTRFTQSRMLYREDENGERVYLDPDQTQSARDRVQQQVKDNCDS